MDEQLPPELRYPSGRPRFVERDPDGWERAFRQASRRSWDPDSVMHFGEHVFQSEEAFGAWLERLAGEMNRRECEALELARGEAS